tara:strand:- start:506 stop:1045 length:540 start_codon:yes stop_codon:yes gene_type:complete
MPANKDSHLTGVERTFSPNEVIVSKTDTKGKITYANRTFYRLAGLTEKETINKPHNIIRHPEMPRCVFKLMWDILDNKQEIFAYVNNRSANGDNYWVFAHVTPSLDDTGNIIGYHSNRRVPDRDIINNHIIPLYKQLLEIEAANSSPKKGMEESYQKVIDLLDSKGMSFNEFMFSLNKK